MWAARARSLAWRDTDRASFAKHPWSIGGGGASDLLQFLDDAADSVLGTRVEAVGFASFPGADEVFLSDTGSFRRSSIKSAYLKPIVFGELVRDYGIEHGGLGLVLYDDEYRSIQLDDSSPWFRYLWPFRTFLSGGLSFGGKTKAELGHLWWAWYRWLPDRLGSKFLITFAFVATHNHFVLHRGGEVFTRTAPVMKLPPEAGQERHLQLLGLLNGSIACFWMKQIFHNKGSTVDDRGLASAPRPSRISTSSPAPGCRSSRS
jgi:hypothetical protein